jgi:hypothetical protein
VELPPFSGPQIAGPARAGAPFTLAGRNAVVAGDEEAGIREVRVHPWLVLSDLRIGEAGAAHGVRVTPVSFERLLEVDGRPLLERVFVPVTGPGVIVEWQLLPSGSGAGPCLDPLDLELEWSCPLAGPGGEAGVQAEISATRVLVRGSAPAPGEAAARPAPVLAAFVPGRAAATAAELGAGAAAVTRFRMGVRLVPGERFRLTIAAARDAAALERGLALLAGADALVHAALAETGRRAASGLLLGAPDPGIGLALRWAMARLPRYLSAPGHVVAEGAPPPGAFPGMHAVSAAYGAGIRPEGSARAALRVGLAALAAGDHALGLEAARSALAGAADSPGGEAAATHAASAALLLYARHLLWTGDSGPARDAWGALAALAARVQAAAPAGAPLAGAALGQLALAAESLGRAADAAAFRDAASRLCRADAAARALAEAGGWSDWVDGASAPAFERWRKSALGGLLPARALWSGADGPDDAAATAAVIGGLACGMLGIEADAPRSRLRLRPQIPAEWERLEVRGIRVADAEVVLRYRRLGGLARFEVEQASGGVPLRLVLEPALTGTFLAARVDGVAAALAPRPWGERTLAPVQLVLDAIRVVELEMKETGSGHG